MSWSENGSVHAVAYPFVGGGSVPIDSVSSKDGPISKRRCREVT